MKNVYKNQKGSMAVYVTITILCFIFILTGLFLGSASIRKGQLRTIVEIVDAYQKDNDRVEEIYANREILDTSKYVQNGLVLFYDGINNTGSGHSNKATTWKDLSTSNFDGTLMNFGDNSWTDNSLTFDGIDDWVKIARMDYSNITIEIIMEYESLDVDSEIDIVANWQNGGYGMNIHEVTYKDRNTFAVSLLGKSYQYIQSDNSAKIGKKYILTGSYDGSTMKLWENGIKKESNLEGTIGNTQDNTVMVLGGNPKGENSDASFNGKIYAVRIYNRALTDAEVKQNYELDIQRYGVEDIAKKLDTSKYVKNNLVVFYDGFNNTGNGHSNNATTWTDLSGNGYDLNLNNFAWTTTSGWTDNALHFDGVDDFGEITNLQDKLKGPITITVCFNSEEAKNYRGLFGNHFGNDDDITGIVAQYGNIQGESVFILGYNSNVVRLDWNKTINKNMSLTVQMDPSIGTKVYVNGNLVGQEQNDNNPIRPLETFWVGKSFDGSNRYFLGKMNNFMLYNRLLTDDEIRANYEQDSQRYNIY